MGLSHHDHQLTHQACLPLLRQHLSPRQWLVYEEALYRQMPGTVDERLQSYRTAGLRPHSVDLPVSGDLGRKCAAVSCYPTQLRAFSQQGHDAVFEPEKFWSVE
jgi:LmbE family N-acetylglucosaminyl deacetylase